MKRRKTETFPTEKQESTKPRKENNQKRQSISEKGRQTPKKEDPFEENAP